MSFVVSDSSVASKLKKALYAAILPAVALVHALGYDWGASTTEEQLTRDAAAALTATAVVTVMFALYAQLKKVTVDEPVAVAGAIGSLIAAAYSLCIAFDWGSEGVVTIVFAIVVAFATPFGITVTRAQTKPVSASEPQDHFHEQGESVTGLLIALACIAIIVFVIVVLVN